MPIQLHTAAQLTTETPQADASSPRVDIWYAAALALALFCIYFSNGREIGSVDSQPTKYAAREFLLRGSLGLGHVVGVTPELAKRHTFMLARDGRYRSVYSPVPALAAATVTWPLGAAGAIDLRGPLAPAIIAKFTAALLTAVAVAIGFLTARRHAGRRQSALVAIGLGLGTGLWSTVSQTLWQHETTMLGLSLAIYALSAERLGRVHGLVVGVGLALACASRLPLVAASVVLLLAVRQRGGTGPLVIAASIVALAGAALILFNLETFGHPLGALPYLERLHPEFHGTDRSFQLGWEGYAGLLLSPSRGLLVFSPVVAVVALGFRDVWTVGWDSPLRWCFVAAAAQFLLYGAYSVWWAGHTYGPRYLLDVLPLLVPIAAFGVVRLRLRSIRGACAALALAWSIGVAALGAFVYPADVWNSLPRDVDRAHSRLWDWRDTQIRRAMQTPLNDRNFILFRSVGP